MKMYNFHHSTVFIIFLLNQSIAWDACLDDQPQNSYCNQQRECQWCNVSSCLTCDSDLSTCLTCSPGQYLFQNKCVESKPQGAFCENYVCQECKNKQCQSCEKDLISCTNNCKVEKCIKCNTDKNQCDQCQQGFIVVNNRCIEDSKIQPGCPKNQFSYKNKCYSVAPANTNCNSQTMICKQCKSDKCFECEQDLQTCKRCMPNTYYYEKNCFDEKPKYTYCKKDKLSSNNIQNCFKCFQCQGSDCQQDKMNSILKSNNTLCYDSSFTNNEIIKLHKSGEITQRVQSQSSMALSVAQGVFSQSGSGILFAGLICQKFAYSILIEANIPAQVYAPLKAKASQIPSQDLKTLNILPLALHTGDRNYHNNYFKNVNLEYSILNGCGQGITIFLICSFFYFLFFFAIEKNTQTKIISFSKILYSKLICQFVVQYFQLLISMFTIGINSQILEFAHEDEVEYIGIKITMILSVFFIIMLILFKLYYYLNFSDFSGNNLRFNEINREIIQNETIFQSKIRRNFMLIYLFSESVLLPTIFIQFNQNSTVCLILALIIQSGMLLVICLFMPFLSKLANIYFIIDSILWIVYYIQYFQINLYYTEDNMNKNESVLDNLSYSIIITIHLILIANPVYQILKLIHLLIDFFQKKQFKLIKEALLPTSQHITRENNIFIFNQNNIDRLRIYKKKIIN